MIKTSLTAAALLTFSTGIACAHPGARLITTSADTPRTATTSGVSFEMQQGVHVYGGASAGNMEGTLEGSPAHRHMEKRIEIELFAKRKPWRRLRKMRTQGFYSGIAYPSRRYTQGFYSGQ